MLKFTENDLSDTLLDKCNLRMVEPTIYSVLPDNASGSEYDTQFGFLYDVIACNTLYNRLIWGYSVSLLSKIADQALRSSETGYVLDLGCGSLAFTVKNYSQNIDRPVVLMDQSMKMLQMAKARFIKQNGFIPDNVKFLHADARQLPFKNGTFTTILSQNLLHCLDKTGDLLSQLKTLLELNGTMYFSTLVKADRFADKYYQSLADSGKLVSRNVADHQQIFTQAGLTVEYKTTGNMLVIQGTNL